MTARQATARRLALLRGALRERDIEAILLSNMLSIRWLTSFTGSFGFVYVDMASAWLAVDSRYRLQASEQCDGLEIRNLTSSAADNLTEMLGEAGTHRIGVESDHLTVAALERYRERLDGKADLVPVADVVRILRYRKDETELAAIEQACAIADEVFTHICGVLRPGTTERDIMLEIEWRIRKVHKAEVAFPTIVVSGPRTAMPHGQPSDRTMEVGDLVTLDFGARWDGYCSDITRTVVVGRANEEQRRVYDTVLHAQQRAVAAMTAGVPAKDVDAQARKFIADAGHGDHFGHGLGHGVGLEVHDGPNMSPRSDFALEAGMVMTVEPGIYVPEWGGVRIEDDVLVMDGGCRVLTQATRELLEL